ncbi:MAG: alpha/beta fold hydrolase [Proteobacteria bacterium]|nr:alpha/beta fold hydrolase [Pseudomonadota bacterium]
MTPAELVAAVKGRAREIRTPCGDGTMVWRAYGAGPHLALLHGGHGAWSHWIRNVEPLGQRFTVLTADMPGYGDSARPPEPYSAASIAEIVARGLDEIVPKGERYHVAGFSFGGVVGGNVAAIAGARCASMTVVGSNGLGLQRPELESMGSWRRLSDPEEIRTVHRRNLGILMIADKTKIDELAVHIQTTNTARTFVASRPISRTGALKEALVRLNGTQLNGIWGERDATAGAFLPDRERMFRALQPTSRFRVIPDAGHWVAYEAADPFNATLSELLTTTA